MSINWITPPGLIGSFAEEKFVSYELNAIDTGASRLSFTVIAGDLTHGLQLFERDVGTVKAGTIQGVPVVEIASTTQKNFSQQFTVRATNTRGEICDRTFEIIINEIAQPQIIPKVASLGSYYDGYYLNIQLDAVDPNPLAVLSWKILEGSLPLGTSMSESGRITGYIEPFISPAAEALLNWNKAGWDFIPWDCPTATAQSRTYSFKVEVFDGSNIDIWRYTIFVQAKSLLTVDNDHILVDTDTLTADLDNKHRPYMITLPQDLPEQRQDSNFAFKFDGKDLDGDEVRYAVLLSHQTAFDQGPTEIDPLLPSIPFDEFVFDQDDDSLPHGVTLDRVTGWMTGHLGTQAEERKTYTFYVYCYKIRLEPI